MNFKLEEAIEILERTPKTLELFLSGLSDAWLVCNEGEGTWSSLEVIEHLIEGEKNNWIPRLEFILKEGEHKPFPEFDRFSHLKKSDRLIEEAFQEFKTIRSENILRLKELISGDVTTLEKTGYHPAFGIVKVRELLSTWVVHDLTHISQIVRVIAMRYKIDVGPWIEYLGVLKK